MWARSLGKASPRAFISRSSISWSTSWMPVERRSTATIAPPAAAPPTSSGAQPVEESAASAARAASVARRLFIIIVSPGSRSVGAKCIADPVADAVAVGGDHVEPAGRQPRAGGEVLQQEVLRGAHQPTAL